MTEESPDEKYRKTIETLKFDPADGWSDAQKFDYGDNADHNVLWSLLRQISPGTPLSKITLPAFILEPKSQRNYIILIIVEMYSQANIYPDLLCYAVNQPTPEGRFLYFLRWILAPWRIRQNKVKKPYNPILGEVFRCFWESENYGKTVGLHEQVSHHPPISTIHFSNKKQGFVYQGSMLARAHYVFPTGGSVESIGTCSLEIDRYPGETYVNTFPTGYVPNVFATHLHFELKDKTVIKCEKTGWRAEVDHLLLGNFLWGNKEQDLIKGMIFHNDVPKYKLSGKWSGEIFIQEANNKKNKTLFFPDPQFKRVFPKTIPIKDQEWYESRRLWQHMTRALWIQDIIHATAHKNFLEERQRAERKKRNEDNGTWKPLLFKRLNDADDVHQHYILNEGVDVEGKLPNRPDPNSENEDPHIPVTKWYVRPKPKASTTVAVEPSTSTASTPPDDATAETSTSTSSTPS